MITAHEALCEIVARHSPSGTGHPIPNVMFRSGRGEDDTFTAVLEPMLCFILQGSKRIVVGNQDLTFGPNSVLALSLRLPVSGRMVDGTVTYPHLGMAVYLDPDMIAELLLDLPDAPPVEALSFSVTPMEATMAEPLLRLARLPDCPDDARVLGPMAIREIAYRAMRGPAGPLLCEYARRDGRTAQIRPAVDWILTHLDQRLDVDALAALAGMSVRTFHRSFKQLTAQSPLQFAKHARLYKARNALRTSQCSVAQAAFAVGYESASQFSREYARQFGHPPIDDVRNALPALPVGEGVRSA